MSKAILCLSCVAGLVGVRAYQGYQAVKNARAMSEDFHTENYTQFGDNIQIEYGNQRVDGVDPDEPWLVAAAKRVIANVKSGFSGDSESDQGASETGSLWMQKQVDVWEFVGQNLATQSQAPL